VNHHRRVGPEATEPLERIRLIDELDLDHVLVAAGQRQQSARKRFGEACARFRLVDAFLELLYPADETANCDAAHGAGSFARVTPKRRHSLAQIKPVYGWIYFFLGADGVRGLRRSFPGVAVLLKP
jgi:hypothetical protein